MQTATFRTPFKDLCPPLTDEERANLEASLVEDGCLQALVVWKGHDALLDGHNRLEICERRGIAYDVRELDLEDEDAATCWVLRHQLSRRNLNPAKQRYLRAQLYEAEKRQGARTDRTSPQSEGKSHTAERIAADTGVSRATIERDARFARSVDKIAETAGPEAREEILSGRLQATDAMIRRAAEEAVPDVEALRDHVRQERARRKTSASTPVDEASTKFRQQTIVDRSTTVDPDTGEELVDEMTLSCGCTVPAKRRTPADSKRTTARCPKHNPTTRGAADKAARANVVRDRVERALRDPHRREAVVGLVEDVVMSLSLKLRDQRQTKIRESMERNVAAAGIHSAA